MQLSVYISIPSILFTSIFPGSVCCTTIIIGIIIITTNPIQFFARHCLSFCHFTIVLIIIQPSINIPTTTYSIMCHQFHHCYKYENLYLFTFEKQNQYNYLLLGIKKLYHVKHEMEVIWLFMIGHNAINKITKLF